MIKRLSTRIHPKCIEALVAVSLFSIALFVLTPTIIDTIDDMQYQMDTREARNMTTALRKHIDSTEVLPLDAEAVRQIVLSDMDHEVDFVPRSGQSGYFYVARSQSIVVSKYDQVERIVQPALSRFDEIKENLIMQPCESFDRGLFLLTESGSVIADSIRAISNLADQENIEASFERIVSDLEKESHAKRKKTITNRSVLDETIEDLLENIKGFHPEKTLYLNEEGFVTGASRLNDIERVVFSSGMIRVPSMELELDGFVEIPTLYLPGSIQFIDSRAFTRFVYLDKIIHNNPMKLDIANSAFYQQKELEILSYSRTITVTEIAGTRGLVSGSNDLSFDMSVLQDHLQRQGIEMTRFEVSFNINDPSLSKIYIYTGQGLIGYVVPEITDTN